jgi:hypothetical protein
MGFNSTIIVKKKKLKCGCFDYNFSKGRCKSHATQEDSQKRIDAYEDTVADESLQNLIDDLDAVFSRFIRLKYADNEGNVECYCCRKKRPIGEMQNGHFIHRTDMGTRFLESNCRPQCPLCNSKHNDDPSIYATRLEEEQKGITAWLLEQSREVVKPTRDELKQLTINYRYQVRVLEKKIKTTDMKRTDKISRGPQPTPPPPPPPPDNP